MFGHRRASRHRKVGWGRPGGLVDGMLFDLAEHPPGLSLSDRMRMAARDRDRHDMPATMKALRQLVAAQAGQLGTIETMMGQILTEVRALNEARRG